MTILTQKEREKFLEIARKIDRETLLQAIEQAVQTWKPENRKEEFPCRGGDGQ